MTKTVQIIRDHLADEIPVECRDDFHNDGHTIVHTMPLAEWQEDIRLRIVRAVDELLGANHDMDSMHKSMTKQGIEVCESDRKRLKLFQVLSKQLLKHEPGTPF